MAMTLSCILTFACMSHLCIWGVPGHSLGSIAEDTRRQRKVVADNSANKRGSCTTRDRYLDSRDYLVELTEATMSAVM